MLNSIIGIYTEIKTAFPRSTTVTDPEITGGGKALQILFFIFRASSTEHLVVTKFLLKVFM